MRVKFGKSKILKSKLQPKYCIPKSKKLLFIFFFKFSDWATVSSDGVMKIWRLNFKSDSLTLKHTRTLQLKESVLALEFTPDSKFIAVALIDSTVKVFYRDTLKFWNSLYGHHLPVNCLAASEDSTLMVTGSADRSVKVINNKKTQFCIFFKFITF